MKFTTSRGVDVEVLPIALSDRDKFLAMKAVNDAYSKHEEVEAHENSDSEAQWEAQWELQEKLCALCGLVGVSPDSMALVDSLPLISVLQTGQLPPDFTETGETKP